MEGIVRGGFRPPPHAPRSRRSRRRRGPPARTGRAAARALETAETLARELGIAPRFVARIDVLYLATPDLLASVVNGADARIGHLLLVGHNPGISEYARRLAPDVAPRSLPTGACVTLHCGAEGWQAVAADS